MRTSGLRHTLVVAVCALPLVAGGFMLRRQGPEQGSRILQGVLDIVANQAVDSLAPDSLYITAARGLLEELRDPYAGLFSPKDFASFSRNALGNRYGGIGLRIVSLEGDVTVWRVIPGGPAGAAGVERGDRILQIGDSAVRGWPTLRVADALTGAPGTTVHVVFGRRATAERFSLDLVRSIISVPSVPFTALLPGAVGYLPVVNFSDHSAEDVAQALARLEAAGATRFLLDLRGNGGGSLDQAVQMTSLFIGAGRVAVRVRSRQVDDSLRGSMPALLGSSVPIAALVDSGTASATEILVGALQDYDRALVVGTDTYGKGVAQGTFRLPDGWVLKLTTARWLTPAGRQLQRTHSDSMGTPRTLAHSFGGRGLSAGGGIVPDVLVFDDSLATGARLAARALGAKAAVVGTVLDSIAESEEGSVHADFVITPRLHAALVRRLREAGIGLLDRPDAAVDAYLDRLLDSRITAFALSDSAAFVRRAPADTQLKRAAALLRGAPSQLGLFEESQAADSVRGS